jgi:hypothetical protein
MLPFPLYEPENFVVLFPIGDQPAPLFHDEVDAASISAVWI